MSRLLTINKAIIGGIFLSLLLLANSFAWAATTEDVESFNDNYPGLSTEALLRLVVKGDELAQHEWGNRLALGASGAPANRSAAAMWYSRAAQRGTPGSASLSSLPNAPLRVDRTAAVASASTVSAPPSVQLADPTESVYELTRTIDGSASSSSQSITHYIWDVWSDSDQSANITDLGAGQAQVIFPNHGTWFVTLIILDASGQIDHQTQTHTILEPLPPAPTAPELNAPSADQIVQSTTQVTFSWLLADSADSYEFEIFTNTQDAESPINVIAQQTLNSADCQSNACAVAAEINAATGSEIFWRVRASNTGGASDWIDSRILIVAPATGIPGTPDNDSPDENTDVNRGEVTEFVWAHEEQVETYDFGFFNNSNGSFGYVASGLRAFDLCSGGMCRYEVSVDLPVTNRHGWRVRGINSLGTSSLSQTFFDVVEPVDEAPAAPVLAAPANDSMIEVGQLVSFSWERAATAAAYELQIVDTANSSFEPLNAFVQDVNCGATQCSSNITIDLPIADTYEWKVRATNAAGGSEFTSRAFTVFAAATMPPDNIVTISPPNYTDLVIGSTVTFEWQSDVKATSYDFLLNDAGSNTFPIWETNIPANSICNTETCSVTRINSVAVAGASNQWRVKAHNSVGSSELSQSFFTAIEPYTEVPADFSLLSPTSAESLVQNTDVTFTWEHADRTESYVLSLPLSDGSTASIPVFTNNCDADQCNYTTALNLPIEDDYEWQVSAVNSVGQTYSSIFTFSVVLEIIEPPEAPVLVAPIAAASFDVYSEIIFEWETVTDATGYDFFITDANEGAQPIQAGLLPADVCTANSCSITIDQDLSVGNSHTWQVRAKRDGVDSEWSQRGFAVLAPVAPALQLPLATTEFEAEDAVEFQWSVVENASAYDFFITDANTGVLPAINDLAAADTCTQALCSISVALDLTVSDSHTWQVRSKRQDVASEWSVRDLIVVPPSEPIALFTMVGFDDSIATKTGPLTITFDPSDSTDDNGIVTYKWDFGDGSTTVTSSTPDTQTHTYDTPGNYTAKLTVTDEADLSNEKTASITVLSAGTPATDIEAARLLTQATFGPTRSSIEQVKTMGISNWLDWQLSIKGDAHLDYVQIFSNGSYRPPRHEVWWADVVEGEDQLRQRVAFALSQIFVVSDTGFTLSNAQYAVTHYYDILRNHAFGNYRDLLEEVTLSPVMGLYLSMLQNAKGQADGSTRADENYAREILQLFSIGLHNLNIDGTTDGSPSFNQDQIEAFARVFTGWNYADAGNWDRALNTNADMISQMLPFEEYHDTDAKTLLNGVVAPAGNTARQDLEIALDNIFNHPNVGPFIGKQLIKRLVTSNPSTGYVSRVAQVFNNNGAGVRGDLGAVVRAILSDTEARSIPSDVDHYGKLREPVLRLSHLWRAFNIQRGNNNDLLRNEFNTVSPPLDGLESVTGQAVLRSPSVFNFFQPTYSPAGPVADANLDAPEFELFTEGNELATSNRIGRQIQNEYAGNPYTTAQNTSYLDYSYELTIADDSDALLDHLDIVLLSGNMSTGLRGILKSHIDNLLSENEELSQVVRDAITLIMASPDYLVQM